MYKYSSSNADNLPAHQRVRELFDYDPATGSFHWRVTSSNRAPAGSKAGAKGANGYIYIRFDGKMVLAHRLAWFHIHGVWPKDLIDHINGNRADNRLQNLREASLSQNAANGKVRSTNSSGIAGVSWDKSKNGWVASITVDGRQIKRRFKNLQDAIDCRLAFIANHQGDFGKSSGPPALQTDPTDAAQTSGLTLVREV